MPHPYDSYYYASWTDPTTGEEYTSGGHHFRTEPCARAEDAASFTPSRPRGSTGASEARLALWHARPGSGTVEIRTFVRWIG